MHLTAVGELEHGLHHGSGRDPVRVGLEPRDDVVVQGAATLIDQLEGRVLLAEREAVLDLQSVGGVGLCQLSPDGVLATVDRLPNPSLCTVDELEGDVGRVIPGWS